MRRRHRSRPVALDRPFRAWLAERSPPAAARAVDAIAASLAMIERCPEHGRELRAPIRETFANFGRDRFVIRDRVAGKDVIVTRVFHGRQRR